MTDETTSSEIFHVPYGEHRPYDSLPYERSPRDPASGEPVRLGVATPKASAFERIECLWQVRGSTTQNRAEARKCGIDESEGLDLWEVDLPSFNGGESIRYSFTGTKSSIQIWSEEYTFTVSTWIALGAIIQIEEQSDRLNVVLGTGKTGTYVRLQVEPDQWSNHNLRLSAVNDYIEPSDLQPISQSITMESDGLRVSLNSDARLEITRQSDGLILRSAHPIEVLVDSRGRIQKYRLGFDSPTEEAFYGFGERFNALNQRGNILDNYVYAQYTHQGKKSYIPIPFFISSRGYGVWLKTERQAEFNLAANDSTTWNVTGQPEEASRDLDFVLFFQTHPHGIIQAFTNLTGKPKLPPSWVFGLWMSSNDWNSQAEIERQMKLAQMHQIPYSVIVIEAWSDESNFYIWNDAAYQLKDPSLAYSLCDFSFPENGHWPDPKKMIDAIHRAEARLVLWQIPVIKRPNPEEHLDERQKYADQKHAIQNQYVVRTANGSPHKIEPHSPWFSGSMVPDFTHPEAARWWVQKRKYLMEEMGVDGFKTDGGEHVWDPESKFYNGLTGSQGINTYPVTYESAYHNLCESLRGPDHVLFSRAGYTGVQKYSCHWLGDEVSTWEVFRAGVIAMQNAGMCGLSFMGWDIAGFAGELPSSELYLRATAFSVFCPIMQFHSDGNGRRIPSRDRTPWNIQEQSGDPEVLPIFKQLTNLRMNLMPYILEQAKQSSQTGLPLMRALGVEYPQDEACRELPYEYMFGEDLLVAPVVEAGRTELDVYLPEGRWSDLWTGEIFDGRRTIHMAVPRDCIPVFQRKNSIVPLSLGEEREICSPVGSATENIQNLTLLVFPGERQEIKINQGKEHPALHMLVQEDAGLRRIELRELRIPVDLWIVGAEPREINYNGVKLPRTESNTGLNEASWQVMTNRHAVRIHIPGGERRANLLLE